MIASSRRYQPAPVGPQADDGVALAMAGEWTLFMARFPAGMAREPLVVGWIVVVETVGAGLADRGAGTSIARFPASAASSQASCWIKREKVPYFSSRCFARRVISN